MEAALRTVYKLVTGSELPVEKLHLMGLAPTKTAKLKIEIDTSPCHVINDTTCYNIL